MKKIWLIIAGIVIVIGVVIAVVITHSDQNDNKRKYKVHRSKLSPIKEMVHIEVNRYEVDLFAMDTNDLVNGIKTLSEKYPEILIQKGAWENPQMVRQLQEYINDPVIRDIQAETINVFPDLTELTKELEDALILYLYYYPGAEIPHFFTLAPGIDFHTPSTYLYENDLFINLDLYLGSQYKLYDQYHIPKYISERFDKKYVAIDCFKKAIVYRHLPQETRLTLLDHIIYEGKKLYFTELMFPHKPDQEIIGYNDAKYTWAVQHHGDVWNYIIGKNQLFSKNETEVSAYINESPFTKPFSNDSPGRMGTFIGWKIIQGFMENNPEINLSELMSITDSRMILNKSKYKPLKR